LINNRGRRRICRCGVPDRGRGRDRAARGRSAGTGERFPLLWTTLAMIIGAPLVVVLTLTALAQFRQKD
jgi:hypothetical protein